MDLFRSLREQLTPQLTESKFKSNGVLTPNEFVLSGDHLVQICPGWQWVSTKDHDQFKVREYLPLDKQFLITKNVSAKPYYNDIKEEEHGEDLLITVPQTKTLEVDDLDKLDLDVELSDSFDVMITYDKYYQTPRVWLTGYTANGTPMTPDQMMAYISSEHAQKTATVEQHPHLQITCISIHPCQHASVMKLLFSQDISVDQYMAVFLKFISTIIPTIEYDYLNI